MIWRLTKADAANTSRAASVTQKGLRRYVVIGSVYSTNTGMAFMKEHLARVMLIVGRPTVSKSEGYRLVCTLSTLNGRETLMSWAPAGHEIVSVAFSIEAVLGDIKNGTAMRVRQGLAGLKRAIPLLLILSFHPTVNV